MGNKGSSCTCTGGGKADVVESSRHSADEQVAMREEKIASLEQRLAQATKQITALQANKHELQMELHARRKPSPAKDDYIDRETDSGSPQPPTNGSSPTLCTPPGSRSPSPGPPVSEQKIEAGPIATMLTINDEGTRRQMQFKDQLSHALHEMNATAA